MNKISYLSVRMDQLTHDKFQYIAAFEGRSMSRQLICLVRNCIREFEEKYGSITERDIADVRRF